MKEFEKTKHPGWWIFFLGMITCIWCIGCPSTPSPDFERLKADLEKKLSDNRGNVSKGNADIYAVVSLSIIRQTEPSENEMRLEFKGEVECLTGFYMAADGKYSLSKPQWKAKRHVTKGTRIGFSGTVGYRLNGGKWTIVEFFATMEKSYAPPF